MLEIKSKFDSNSFCIILSLISCVVHAVIVNKFIKYFKLQFFICISERYAKTLFVVQRISDTHRGIDIKSTTVCDVCTAFQVNKRSNLSFTKISATDYQLLTENLVQIRNAISILNVINQQISRSIRVMFFLFFLVLLYIPFVCAKVVQKSVKRKVGANKLTDNR